MNTLSVLTCLAIVMVLFMVVTALMQDDSDLRDSMLQVALLCAVGSALGLMVFAAVTAVP